jgi:hypothetical protein
MRGGAFRRSLTSLTANAPAFFILFSFFPIFATIGGGDSGKKVTQVFTNAALSMALAVLRQDLGGVDASTLLSHDMAALFL